MFKSSCLVFRVRWLESLCLVSAPTRPSFFIPVKNGVGAMCCLFEQVLWNPFYFDHAGRWRWTVTVHRQLTHPPPAWCLSTALSGKYYLHSWKKANLPPSFHLFCFPGGVLRDRAKSHFLTFLGISQLHLIQSYTRSWKALLFFSSALAMKLSRLHCMFVSWSSLPDLKKKKKLRH